MAAAAGGATQRNVQNMFTLLGSEDDSWPLIKNLGGFFANKINVCKYATFGMVAPAVDASIVEKIGCHWGIFATKDAEMKAAADAVDALTKDDAEFIVDVSDIAIHQINSQAIRDMKRIDICRLDAGAANRMILYEMIDAGFRPGILMIRFAESPDEHVPTQLAAGHLQNCGYALMGIHEDKYLYYYIDDCVYDYCSWTEIGMQNPLMKEILSTAVKNIAQNK
jgi:hypothetical protein